MKKIIQEYRRTIMPKYYRAVFYQAHTMTTVCYPVGIHWIAWLCYAAWKATYWPRPVVGWVVPRELDVGRRWQSQVEFAKLASRTDDWKKLCRDYLYRNGTIPFSAVSHPVMPGSESEKNTTFENETLVRGSGGKTSESKPRN